MFGRADRKILQELEEVESKLDVIIRLLRELLVKPVDRFVIIGGIVEIKPGQSTVLTALPLALDGSPTSLPAGDIPAWAVSDSSKVSVSPSADGLSLSVSVNAGALPGDVVFQITDGVIPTAQGSFTLTIPAPTVAPVASFNVTASTPA